MRRPGGLRNTFTQFTDQTHLVNGLPPLIRRPDFWARAFSELMDLLTFAAIYITGEVRIWPFVVALALSLIRIGTRFRLKALWIVAGFIVQIFVGIELVLHLQLHPIISAVHVAPIGIAWIGLARGGEDLWGWRMGLGFIGLILASALTPDFSVMLFILAFIITASVGIACRFLSSEFVRRGVTGSLPPGFIRSSFYQSGILLFSALLIFPFIPRVQGRGGGIFGGDSQKTGYTEEVTLNEWKRVSSQGSSAPALRIYGPNGADPSSLIQSGLLRSRVLSVLDKDHWNPPPVKLDTATTLDDKGGASTLTIVREMLGPANLPVPYGTQEVNVELYGYQWTAEKTIFSEWREGRSKNQRFNYQVKVNTLAPLAPQDAPTAGELDVPANFQSSRMKSLADRLFKGNRSPEAKIGAVRSFFQRENFRAVYAEDDGEQKEIDDQKLPPIERFLFVEKSGHCELFASSLAILLRIGGVPTRLIAGFRVSGNSIGDVLTVRQSDAHAWVEAYIPGHGWTVVDPTPRILRSFSVTDWLRDTYDWASAKWTQYILNYGEGDHSVASQWEKFKKIGSEIAKGKNPLTSADSDTTAYLFAVIFFVGSATFSLIAIAVLRRLRRPKRKFTLDRIKREIARERVKMDQICAQMRASKGDKRQLEPAISGWFNLYERVRFGNNTDPGKETLSEIRRQRVAIEKIFKKSS